MIRNIVLRPNAVQVYGFLSTIAALHSDGSGALNTMPRILDCGAGGPLPPLVLFSQHGFDAWGIDASQDQVDLAVQFCEEHNISLHIQPGDMRQIPFEDESFDYVYEHYAMCHLNKRDTARAVEEMRRVLKPGGLCFLGVISRTTWPQSLFGEEREPGEFWGEEDDDGLVLHSLFTDAEADALVHGWTVVSHSKQVRYLTTMAEETSSEDWMKMYPQAPIACLPGEWQARYSERAGMFQYVHNYYILKKVDVN